LRHEYDFVIFSKGRSGTHMLASFLNSHPMISCEGEFEKFDLKVQIKSRCLMHGAIFMYNVQQFAELGPRPKVIHLTRDPKTNALSFARQQKRLNLRRAGETDLPGAEFKIPSIVHIRLADALRRQQDVMRKVLIRCRYRMAEVTYEEITEGGEATVMPEAVGRRLCRFLGVTYHPMTCDTRVEFGTSI